MAATIRPARRAIDFRLNQAEQLVCEELERQLPDGSTVIYDYGYTILQNGTFVDGQVDFIVVLPSVGLCFLEVKGTRKFEYRDGRWYRYQGRNGSVKADDPFQQVTRNKHNVVGILKHRMRVQNFPGRFGSLVVYPRGMLVGDQMPAAYDRSLLVTSSELRSLGDLIQNGLLRWGQEDSGAFTGDTLDEVLQILTSGGDLVPVIPEDISEESSQIEELTADQWAALQTMFSHSRVVVNGPAGSGKTLLALSHARRLAATGHKRVLWTCYNSKLADWIKAREEIETSWDEDGLQVYSFHELARKFIVGIAGKPFPVPTAEADKNKFWRETVATLLDEVTQSMADRWYFDAVVVDEGQDFETSWLVRLQLLLRDPENGPFALFRGDRQRLFTAQDQFIQNVGAISRLQFNCRNTVRIGTYANAVGAINARFLPLAPEGDAPLVLQRLFLPDRAQAAIRIASDWLAAGILPSQIAILSPYAGNNPRSSLDLISTALPVPATNSPRDWLRNEAIWTSTIRSFKGMEADCVVLIDLPNPSMPGFTADDLYVAVSRPKTRLVLLPEDDLAYAELRRLTAQ